LRRTKEQLLCHDVRGGRIGDGRVFHRLLLFDCPKNEMAMSICCRNGTVPGEIRLKKRGGETGAMRRGGDRDAGSASLLRRSRLGDSADLQDFF
jgi:hypothetical protein